MRTRTTGYTYELFYPSGKEVVSDKTPTTTLQGIGSDNADSARPTCRWPTRLAGRWEIVVQLNLTTSGKEFSQVVNGNVTFNNSGRDRDSGLPTSASTTLAQGTRTNGAAAGDQHDRRREDVHIHVQPGDTGGHRADEHLHPGGRDGVGDADADPDGGAGNGRHRAT